MSEVKISPRYPMSFMFVWVRDFIANNHDNVSPSEAADLVLNYQIQRGDDALVGMYGFIRYMQFRRYSTSRVLATVMHDINGMNDPNMLPRTSSYYNFCNQ